MKLNLKYNGKKIIIHLLKKRGKKDLECKLYDCEKQIPINQQSQNQLINEILPQLGVGALNLGPIINLIREKKVEDLELDYKIEISKSGVTDWNDTGARIETLEADSPYWFDTQWGEVTVNGERFFLPIHWEEEYKRLQEALLK